MGGLQVDAYDPAVIAHPFEIDARLRAEAPIYHDTVNDIYLVSSYELIDRIIKDPVRFSSKYMEKIVGKDLPPQDVMDIYAQGFPIVDALLVTDGPRHERHRQIIVKAFSRKRLEELSEKISVRISELVASVLPKGQMAFRADLAHQVPTIITQEQLRIPDEDMPKVLEWSEIISNGFGGAAQTLDEKKHAAREIVAFQHYFDGRLETEMARIVKTGHGWRDDDLLTILAAAILDDDDPMDKAEALSLLFNLLPGTHDTTTATLLTCMHRLVSDPQSQQKLAEDPKLIGKFIDEAMRHDSPIRGFWRRATEDVDVADVRIPGGSWLFLRVSAANHDEEVFESPATFDMQRRASKPNLSFSAGIHSCAGRFYARHIITATLGHLLQHAHDFAFVEEHNTFYRNINILVAPFNELHIRFTAFHNAT